MRTIPSGRCAPGLAVIDAVGKLTTPEPLNVRLGIASGLVIVGDLIGAGAAQERGVVGDTPNLAPTGHTSHCRRLSAADRCAGRDRRSRPQNLAGFAEPQPAYRVGGESACSVASRRCNRRQAPLVRATKNPIAYLRRTAGEKRRGGE
jgi:class 3 adenylate cyclase